MVKMYWPAVDIERATIGRYRAHEAAHLVGVGGDRIGQWSRWGHIRASVSDEVPHVYAFQDVAEALAVHLLLEHGLPLPAIREAVDRLGGPAGWPLSTRALHVVDGHLAVEQGELLVDVFNDHGVLPLNGRVRSEELLRRGGWAAHRVELRHVSVDPERIGGRPAIRGRRIAVELVAELAEDALGVELLAEEYGLSLDEIDDAVRWWAEAHRFAEVA